MLFVFGLDRVGKTAVTCKDAKMDAFQHFLLIYRVVQWLGRDRRRLGDRPGGGELGEEMLGDILDETRRIWTWLNSCKFELTIEKIVKMPKIKSDKVSGNQRLFIEIEKNI